MYGLDKAFCLQVSEYVSGFKLSFSEVICENLVSSSNS